MIKPSGITTRKKALVLAIGEVGRRPVVHYPDGGCLVHHAHQPVGITEGKPSPSEKSVC